MFWLTLYKLLLWTGVLLAVPLSPLIGLWLYQANPKYRAGLKEKLGFYPKAFINTLCLRERRENNKTIWFHAVSVGEVNALRPLIVASIEHYGHDLRVVITTTTATGQGLARSLFPNLLITYFPFDFSGCVDRAFRAIQPDLLVLAETELWPNLIVRGATRHGCKIILANARLSEKSFRGYQKIRPLLKACLSHLTYILSQSPADAGRYRALGAADQTIQVLGNLKFDLSHTVDSKLVAQLTQMFGFADNPVLLFASTFSGEEQPLLAVYKRLQAVIPNLKLVIAPRHPERVPEILALLQQAGLSAALRSQLTMQHPNTLPVVVLDTIGELRAVYAVAAQTRGSIAVVCGSFSHKRGGQNPLEPLHLGLPTVFGPNMQNFKAVVAKVLAHHAALQVLGFEALEATLLHLLQDTGRQRPMGENANALFMENRGGASKTLEILLALLESTKK